MVNLSSDDVIAFSLGHLVGLPDDHSVGISCSLLMDSRECELTTCSTEGRAFIIFLDVAAQMSLRNRCMSSTMMLNQFGIPRLPCVYVCGFLSIGCGGVTSVAS